MTTRDLQRFINILASETIPEPRFRWLFLKIFSRSKFGLGSIPWPGARIYNSKIGRYCGIGMCCLIENSSIGDGSVVAAKAVVKNAKIGRDCFIAANARVTGKVPDGMFVTGTNKMRKRNFTPKESTRNVERIRFTNCPQWDWFQTLSYYKPWGMMRMLFQQFYTNSIAASCRNSKSKRVLSSIYCDIAPTAFIHYSVTLDSMFPTNVHIEDGAMLMERSLVLTHSLIDEAGYIIERGDTVIGKNTILGRDCLVLPGVTVPPGLDIPPNSLVTKSGILIVTNNQKKNWNQLKRKNNK